MKKFKSKFFCVATEGASTDGRTITREWIQQMADTFNRKVYGARIWLEHMRGLYPDGPFKAYGDVMALEAREKEDGKLGLYAEIDPTEDLVQINNKRQKIYTSIEVNPDFAGTGKAYLMGLGITDSPASLGTDVLEFTQKDPENSFLAARKLEKGNLFSAAEETEIELVEVEDKPSMSDRVKGILSHFRNRADQVDNNMGEVLDAVEEIARHSAATGQTVEQLLNDVQQFADYRKDLDALKDEFNTFKKDIKTTDASNVNRPPADGGDGQVQADC